MGDAIVAAVDRQQILDEIVGADAEELAMARQEVDRGRRARNLDHAAHFHLLVKLHLAFPEFLLRFFQNCIGARQLVHAADHRIHHAHPSKRAGPEDGPQLLLEQLRVLQAEADRPEAQKRIGLVVGQPGNALQRFVAAQVERANDHGVGRKGRDDRPVARKLLVFAGQSRGIQVEILRAKESNSLRLRVPHRAVLLHLFQVRQQDDVHAVQRFRRQAAGGLKARLEALLLGLNPAIAEQRLLGGIDDHHPFITVDQHPVAAADPRREIPDSDHRRNLQRARHDDGMARLAADVGNDGQGRAAVDPGGIGRRDVVGDHHAFLSQFAQMMRRLAQQIPQDPLGDVANVASPFPQVFIVNLVKRFDVPLGNVVEAGLDIDAGGFEFPYRLADQRLIFEHHQVGIEDPRFIGPQILLHLILDLGDLLTGGDEPLIEAGDLLDPLAGVDLIDRHLQVRLQVKEDLAVGNAIGRGDALDCGLSFLAGIHRDSWTDWHCETRRSERGKFFIRSRLQRVNTDLAA